ncbi:MAG: DUF418 domain-containing protein [Bacteroidales bacterium]|nr:DUF418 domain-containing protein [Bacteroidales bacterium]
MSSAASQAAATAAGPTTGLQRHVVLDALRGTALMGIALANFPEFALWTFLSPSAQEALPTAAADRVVRFLQYLFIDGKFYTIFSLLFGIGFALILERHSLSLFVRRMLILVAIGLLHLLFIWSGDILLLYAVGGLLLTLFVRRSTPTLLYLAAALILVPVVLDALTEFCGMDFAAPFYQAWWNEADTRGITEDNFATWLRDAHSYPQMFAFLCQGAYERIWEFVSGHRLPKVLGLFILGYLIGKHRLYARLPELPLRPLLRRLTLPALLLSFAYAWSATHHQPWGLTLHSALYAFSVIPLAACYVAAFSLKPVKMLAAPGRMALTNYISQSVIGILIFYGMGFGLGTRVGLIYVELIAMGVFAVQIVLSHLWLHYFRFGPLEWVWRMLTYGRYFPLLKRSEPV